MTQNNKLKTGTTCIGLIFKGGVMLAADNRVTSYKINNDNFPKLFNISNQIVSTVSGGVADAQRFIRVIKGELKLISFKNEREVFVNEAVMTLTNYQYSGIRSSGSIVGMIVGGYDKEKGISLHDLGPDGSIINHDGYVTSGSGSVYIDGILSSDYNKDLSEKDALSLIEKCFKASFKHDNASGGGFIIKVITEKGITEAKRKAIKTEFVDRE